MLSYFKSAKGEGGAKNIIFLLIIIIAAFAVFQFAKTKIAIASMKDLVHEQAMGSRKEASFDSVIRRRLLERAMDEGIITAEDIDTGGWTEKMEIYIYRPMHDRIQITVTFEITTNYLLFKSTEEVEIYEEAKIYSI